MTRSVILALVAFAIVLAVLFVAVHRLYHGAKIVALPARINNVNDGMPYAIEVKDSLAPEARLTSVMVDLETSGDALEARRLTYGFASILRRDRMIAVVVDNATRKAFCGLDTTEFPSDPAVAARARKALDQSRVTLGMADALKIAETNGLAEFRSLTGPDAGDISLWLGTSDDGPVWDLTGDGWDESGPIADLKVTINAENGSVIQRILDKAANRPRP